MADMNTDTHIIKTTEADYAPFYAGYVKQIPPSTVHEILSTDVSMMERLFEVVSEEKANEAYAEGKWTIKELVQHMIDVERIFCVRAMMVARGETSNIPGFDHDAYVEKSNANLRPWKSLGREWRLLRSATQALFGSFQPEDFAKRGTANGMPISVGALAYITAGHSMHHLQIIEERYGVDL